MMSKLDVGQKTQQKRFIKNPAYNSMTDTQIFVDYQNG